jgi:prophage regulatory protein
MTQILSIYPVAPAFLDLPAVEQTTSLRKSSIYLNIRRGTFPAAVRISARRVAWRAADIEKWLAAPLEWSANQEAS